MKKTKLNGTPVCGWCVQGNHRQCPGDCACAADRGHRPSGTLAARMFRARCPDLADLDDNEAGRRYREQSA